MKIAITGGAGFLGLRVAHELAAAGSLALGRAPAEPIDEITLLDRQAPPAHRLTDHRMTPVVVDLASGAPLPALADVDVVFHLAAAVSAECEADFDLGMRTNLAGGQAVLEAARAGGRRPVFVFASSLAVYGRWPHQQIPDVVTDDTLPTPTGSYGAQKFVLEQLVAEYARKDYVDGRNVRLMTVVVRPGRPNGAASSFLSSVIREPLAGERATCPVDRDLAVALSSPESTVAGLIRAATTDADTWGPPLAVNLPAVHTFVGELVGALDAVAGPAATELIDWRPDPAIAAIVGSWPARFTSARAAALGLTADPDIATVVRRYAASVGRS